LASQKQTADTRTAHPFAIRFNRLRDPHLKAQTRAQAPQEVGIPLPLMAKRIGRPADDFGHADAGSQCIHPRLGGHPPEAFVKSRDDGNVDAHLRKQLQTLIYRGEKGGSRFRCQYGSRMWIKRQRRTLTSQSLGPLPCVSEQGLVASVNTIKSAKGEHDGRAVCRKRLQSTNDVHADPPDSDSRVTPR